ncbi:hypothetical protein CRENBAI_009970, partial [Crenichthys baileyi]
TFHTAAASAVAASLQICRAIAALDACFGVAESKESNFEPFIHMIMLLLLMHTVFLQIAAIAKSCNACG